MLKVKWRQLLFLGVTVLQGISLSSCNGLLPPPIRPTETNTPVPTATETITPTIVWFPPTFTPTPLTTRINQPTPDLRPGLQPVLLEDDFSQPGAWQTFKTNAGVVAYGKKELSIAVSAPKMTLSSLRSGPVLTDFYLQMKTAPSLCRGTDTYGLLLRASSTIDGYRLMLACNGQIRLERIKAGQVIPLQDWVPSGQVPPGAPLEVTVGVWFVQSEVRIFINDIYQFSVRDPVFPSGKIGVFARSAGDTPLTVVFSELTVQRVVAVLPSITPTPSRTPTRTPILRTRFITRTP
jgi:hypothetical protein